MNINISNGLFIPELAKSACNMIYKCTSEVMDVVFAGGITFISERAESDINCVHVR